MGVHNAYEIMTDDQRRTDTWEKIFGRERLPVKGPARLQYLEPGHGPTLAYDLDTAAIHPFARDRLAKAISERTGQHYRHVLAGLERGELVPVRAGGCQLIEK